MAELPSGFGAAFQPQALHRRHFGKLHDVRPLTFINFAP
jgi:hypothetical protein